MVQWVAISVAAFILGLGTGALAVILITRETREKSLAGIESMKNEMRDSFGNLSLEALGKLTDEFTKLAAEKLGSERELNSQDLANKKELIDKQLERITAELKSVATLVQDLEKDREKKFGELSSRMTAAAEQTSALLETTNALNTALANTSARGQWGERMAEDVLRIAGFVESINYVKQKTATGGSRPDYTFMLPQELKLNMDVKFPLDNYLNSLNADSDLESREYRKRFLADVKSRIKEVTGRDYINPEDNTIDCVLLFIPNEQVYGFIQENDSTILDYGIENRVILCSPVTLIAILAVIRQSVESFALAQTSNEILSLFGQFRVQWEKFTDKMANLGQRLTSAQKGYEELVGARRRQLEKPLNQIEEIRTMRGLPVAAEDDTSVLLDEEAEVIDLE
ncbi:MAG: DNA recombination protein RmuC [Actinobacteria bacterium]|nr:DNA recombination protein RmuC [Actinomycetota bacterium]